MVICDLLIPIS